MQDPKSVTFLRQGDIGTLKRLFKSNHAGLYPVAFRLTRNRDVADEVIRSAFKKLWADREQIDPLEVIFHRLLAYVFRLAHEYRSANDVSGIETGARTTTGEAIADQVGSLTGDKLLTYLLHVVDGYSIRELARAFDSSEDHVREVFGAALVDLDSAFQNETWGEK